MSISKPRLKGLQDYWYQVLKESGFEDCEDVNHELRPLKVWHSLKFRKISSTRMQAATKYYNSAIQLLIYFKFANPLERKIWEYHAAGISRRKIEAILKDSAFECDEGKIKTIITRIAANIK